MPAKKKQPKSAFYFFMLDVQEEIFRQSKMRPPMKELPAIASPRWTRMTEAERAPYVHRAKAEKNSGTTNVREGRRDNQGELLSERRDPMLELEERREKERYRLKMSINGGRGAILQEFYFINFQYLLEMPDDQTDLRYQPVEVAITKYSLEAGIIDTFHTFINPGSIPLGFRYECQLHSDKTHKIPILFELADDNYRQILSNMESFINPTHKPHPDPMFALRSETVMCEQCLEWMQDQAGHILPLSVQEIEILFKLLHENIDMSSSVTMFSAERKLDTEEWNHSSGVRCRYHERESSNHCALATVKKYCFMFSEELCPKYDVAITTNHLPTEEPVEYRTYTITANPPQRNGPVSRSSPPPERSVGGRGVRPIPNSQEKRTNVGRGRGVLAIRQPRIAHGVSDTSTPSPTPAPTPAPTLAPTLAPTPAPTQSSSSFRPAVNSSSVQSSSKAVGGVWGGSSATAHPFPTHHPSTLSATPSSRDPRLLQGVAKPRTPPPGFTGVPKPTAGFPPNYHDNTGQGSNVWPTQ